MRFSRLICTIVCIMSIILLVGAHDARCDVQTNVRISPEMIRLGHDGTIMAVVEFPVGYNLREWKIKSIECQGASALPGSGVKDKSRVIARFRQIDMKNLVIGDAVPLTVTIAAQRRSVAEVFSGADAVKIESYKSPAIACADIAGLAIQDKAFHQPLVISSATPVLADTEKAMPEYCKVVGAVGNNGFQLWLPTSTWNGRMNFEGGGGNCGFIPMVTRSAGIDLLKLGYAVAGTDAGHDETVTGKDASWGYDAKYGSDVAYEREIDYGYRGVHMTTVAAKLLTRSFFGTPAKYNYFRGCSTGGRQGLMEAQRYPEDFDGVIAGDPPLGFTGLSVIFQGWPDWIDFTSPTQRILDGSKLPLITKAVMDACDGLDGVVDGVINDPRVCTWDPITSTPSIMCPGDVPASTCLTVAEANVVRKMHDAPRDTKGNIIYPGGRPKGSEIDWSSAIGKGPALTNRSATMVLPNLQYIMFQPDPGPTYTFFDFPCTPNGCDRDAVAKLALYAPLYNATSPHLERFKHRKGKMIMYGGWSTAASHPYALVDYYERVRKEMGRDTKDFFRLYMIPGMGHCGASLGGPGNATFSQMFPQLVDWVERGIEPREVATTAFTSQYTIPSNVSRTRLLCPYPQVAKYKGAALNSDVAESYTCVYPDYPVPQNEWDHIKLFPWDAPLDFSWWHGHRN